MSNQFEAAKRREKVDALTAHIEELVARLGLNARQDGYLIAELIRGFGDAEWAQACVNVGKPKASVATRLLVIAWFQERGKRAESRAS